MSRQSNEQSLGDVIRELLNTYKLGGKINQARIIESWEEVVGEMIMKHTRNLYVKGRKLFVELDSPALKTELSYSKTRILDSLNEKAGAEIVDDIIFR